MPFPTPHITNIKLLTGVPLDATYRHSIYFASAGAQQSYFSGKAVSGLVWTDCMYHREKAAIRVNAPIESCEGVNYCMYQNTAYGSKWFYAFVTDHEYINANCTELKIQQDVLQTWYFDYEILPTFIERCHTSTDVIGDNTVAESLNIGEYVVTHTSAPGGDVTRWDIVAFTTFDWSTWTMAPGTLLQGGVYSGLKRTVIGSYDITRTGYQFVSSIVTDPGSKLKDLLDNHADLVDGLVALVAAPHYFEGNTDQSFTLSKPVGHTTPLGANYFPQYIPRNNKLYTAPYTVIMISNGNGSEKMYEFEKFAGSSATFRIYTDRAPDQSLVLVPEGYKGFNPQNGLPDSLNVSECLTMTGFLNISWISDAFKTYLAQNKASIGVSAAIGVGKVVVGAAGIAAAVGGTAATAGAAAPAGAAIGAGASGMLASGVSDIGRLLVDLNDASKQPPKSHGQTTGSALMAINEKRYRAFVLSPTAEYCRIIDNYFDMFGYAQNKIGRVVLNARPHWTYTKTLGAVAAPKNNGCPAGALTEIQSIFDHGVTFWIDGSEVGDYSLDNRV